MAPVRVMRSVTGILVAALLLSACSGQPHVRVTPSADAIVSAAPQECPSSDSFSQAFSGAPGNAVRVDESLLDAHLAFALPRGGCGYAVGPAEASDSGDDKKKIVLAFFNFEASGKLTDGVFHSWADRAGGTKVDGTVNEWVLPDEFAPFPGATAQTARGSMTNFEDPESMPDYTQTGYATVEFYLSATLANTMAIPDNGKAAPVDPTTALANGKDVALSGTYNFSDELGYSVQLDLAGRIEPFTPDVADSLPGEFNIVFTPRVAGTLTNTTVDRNLPSPLARIRALYPSASAVCEGEPVYALGTSQTEYCAVVIGFIGAQSLAADEVIVWDESDGLSITLQKSLDENGPALAELNSPASLFVSFNNSRGDWSGDVGCYSEDAGIWVSTIEGWPDLVCA